jgi:hypothetical protein
MSSLRKEIESYYSSSVRKYIWHNIVTHMPIARQRLDKHIPEVTLSTIEGHSLLGIGPINTHSCNRETVFSGCPCRGIIRGQSQRNRERTEEGQQSTTKFSWKSEWFQWSVQSEANSVSDNDL